MKHILPYLAVIIVLIYGFYNGYIKQEERRNPSRIKNRYENYVPRENASDPAEELQRIATKEYTYRYIVTVIKDGSSQLHFKKDEIMEGGFASAKDAPMIACYVMSLSGEKCEDDYPKEAAMYFSSNCAGCHGEDAKGLDGTYPDLTQRPLLGIAKRKASLKRLMKREEHAIIKGL